MLTETGRIIAVEAESVWVETMRQSTCGACVARGGCGHKLLDRMSKGQHGAIRALYGSIEPDDCALNDQVLIGIPEDVVVRASVIVYLVPLFSMLAGAITVVNLVQINQDLWAVLGALTGLGIGLGAVRWHAWHHSGDESFLPALITKSPSSN
ncbi:MAG: SoxR reducing system RseC family protein [Halieaceae bacterium]|nr:SoxR reducing system RseC family protein [Halieaceae bacterium]